MQQALASVRQLKAVLQRHEEPIAIIGAACRLPGADSLETFWSLLTQQRDAIEEVPASRWSNARYYDPDPMAVGKLATRWAGVIDERAFDAAFFGISDTEAAHMDAQQRIFLEVAWEALVNAGQTRESLRGSQTGVYVGAVNYNDGYARRLFDDIERVNAFSGPGSPIVCWRGAWPICSISKAPALRSTPPARRRWSRFTKRARAYATTSANRPSLAG